MALDFFELDRGIAISEGGDVRRTYIIPTAGPPGGGDADVVSVSSLAQDYTNGDLYIKDTAGSGSDKWVKLATIDDVTTGTSWREPALVRDNTTYADIAAAVTAANVADLVDGVTIDVADRLLFTDLTSGNENIYIVSGSTGAWTFTESANLATAGDTLFIVDGTDAGKTFTYNGTVWVLSNQSDLDELGFIRTFIGKTGVGSETPTYSSNNHVTNGDNLEVAIGKLDAQIGAEISAGNFIGANDDTNVAVEKLDVALADANFKTTALATTAATPDTLLVDDYIYAEWHVIARDGANMRSAIITAAHDGITAGADATTVDFSVHTKLKIGNIAGFSVAVSLTGAAGAQTMDLDVAATGSTDFHVVRTSAVRTVALT
jgi:hypothetical protein